MIFILNRASGVSDTEPPVRGEAVFRLWDEGKFYWAIRLDHIKDLIGLIKVCGKSLVIEPEPVIEKDGFVCYGIRICD